MLRVPLSMAFSLSLLAMSTAWGASELVESTPLSVAGATTVDAAAAKDLFDNEAAFVDLRKENMWNTGRIAVASVVRVAPRHR